MARSWAIDAVHNLERSGVHLNRNQEEALIEVVDKVGAGLFKETQLYKVLHFKGPDTGTFDAKAAEEQILRLADNAEDLEVADALLEAATLFAKPVRTPKKPTQPKKPKTPPSPPKPKPAERVPMALLGAFGVLVALLGIWLLV